MLSEQRCHHTRCSTRPLLGGRGLLRLSVTLSWAQRGLPPQATSQPSHAALGQHHRGAAMPSGPGSSDSAPWSLISVSGGGSFWSQLGGWLEQVSTFHGHCHRGQGPGEAGVSAEGRGEAAASLLSFSYRDLPKAADTWREARPRGMWRCGTSGDCCPRGGARPLPPPPTHTLPVPEPHLTCQGLTNSHDLPLSRKPWVWLFT